MAYRQYIGARYVPLYVGDWDSARNYEPLSIVTDGNGNSYTSLKDVPAGTTLNNRDYWILTSSFSGAVEQLQRRVDTAENNINSIQTDVTNLQNDISTLNDAQTTTNDRIDALRSRVSANEYAIAELSKDRKILFVFDSYGQTYGNEAGDNTTILSVIQSIYGNEIADAVAVGGGGFVRNEGEGTFLSKLQSAVTGGTIDPSLYTDVIVAAGRNDWTANRAEIEAAVRSFFTYVRSTFANVKYLYFGYIANGANDAAHGTQVQQSECKANLYNACNLNGIEILQGVDAVLHNYNYMSADEIHPTAAGKTQLAYAIMQAWLDGYTSMVVTTASPYFVPVTDVTFPYKDGNFKCYSDGNITIVTPPRLLAVQFASKIPAPASDVDYAIGTISRDTLIKYPAFTVDFPSTVFITDKDGKNCCIGGHMAITSDGTVVLKGLYAPGNVRPANGVDYFIIAASQVVIPAAIA